MNVAHSSKTDINDNNIIYVLIGNIPLEFHTPDLRNFFSHSIENESFVCFNYRHRPDTSESKSNLAICKIKPNKYDEFYTLYHNKNWINSKGMIQNSRCQIKKIKAKCSYTNFKNTETSSTDKTNLNSLDLDDINNLLEFRNIPNWMPNGNVGTPTKTFIKYINQCIMPQSLIAKLGINLKHYKKHKKRPYSNVPYNYENDIEENEEEYEYEIDDDNNETNNNNYIDIAYTANGERIVEQIDDEKEIRKLNSQKIEKTRKDNLLISEEDGDDLQDDELEDWERHEALHDDVTKQDRTSPVFYENEIELKWEKGGSGLVFYTVSKNFN